MTPEEDLNEAILRAAEKIRDEDEQLQDPLDELLAEAGETAESRRQAANRALDLLIRHPEAWEKLRDELPLGTLSSGEIRGRFFQQLPGGEDQVPAGTLMVCPEKPTHYRKYLLRKGQVLFCPQHKVKLVPVREQKAKE